MGSWHLPLRLSPLPSLRLMPMLTTGPTATALAATTVATTDLAIGPTVTAMDFTTARGRLSPRPMPMLTTGPMATALAATMAATTDLATGPTVTDMVSTTARGRLRPSLTTVSTLPTTLLLPS